MIDMINAFLSLGTVVTHVVLVLLVIAFFSKKAEPLFAWIGARGMLFTYLLSLTAMLGSLFYSEIAQFAPCVLCWYQRIFMYPLVFLLGMALYKKDTNILPYTILLTVIGGMFSLYHVMLTVTTIAPTTCTFSSGVSCTENYFTMFGYITIPVIALTSFVVSLLLQLLAKKYVSHK